MRKNLRVNLQFNILFILFSLIAGTPLVSAEEYIFEHSDCTARIAHPSHDRLADEIKELKDKVVSELQKRNFTVKELIDGKRLLTGELYFQWDLNFTKESVYHACVIDISLKQAKGQRPRKSDPSLYKKSVKRKVPRITFKGMERCDFAIKESFIHIPTCKKIGFYGEKK